MFRAVAGMRCVQDHREDIINIHVTVTVLLPCALPSLAIRVSIQDLSEAQHVLPMPAPSARKELTLCDRSATYPCFQHREFCLCVRLTWPVCSQRIHLTKIVFAVWMATPGACSAQMARMFR
jgi:hypothetical protein